MAIWITEFGRMPFTKGLTGRDHNTGTLVTLLVEAGIKGGTADSESDEFSYLAAKDKTTCYDLQTTASHLRGNNHEKVAVRHNGIHRRLTDVPGRVVHKILA